MIGVLAANRQPGRFAGLVLLTPSPCYIDHEGFRGGFSRGDIEELLVTGWQLPGLVRDDGTGDRA